MSEFDCQLSALSKVSISYDDLSRDGPLLLMI